MRPENRRGRHEAVTNLQADSESEKGGAHVGCTVLLGENRMKTEINVGLNLETQAELKRLKQYFPYRIVFASYLDGKFETFADHTKRRMNRITRKGGLIWTV